MRSVWQPLSLVHGLFPCSEPETSSPCLCRLSSDEVQAQLDKLRAQLQAEQDAGQNQQK